MRYLSADWIFPVSSDPIEKGILAVKEDGSILAIFSPEQTPTDIKIEQFSGILVPGFVNTHCHLELSHLKGKIPEGTGLIDFLLSVQQFRDIENDVVQEAMQAADEEMYRNGIVAVGDISNTTHSAVIKSTSKLYYHTFIELIGFTPERAGSIFNHGKTLQSAFQKASLSPHAPYSVSNNLLRLIDSEEGLISMHNQECKAEDAFFQDGSGDFNRLYQTFGIPIDHYKAPGTSSLQSWLPNFSKSPKLLAVHNTCTSEEDLQYIQQQEKEVFFCLCPGANRYIERSLPPLDLIRRYSSNISLGTDSLSSNTQLNILAEIEILQHAFPDISFQEFLTWACLNGALFLGIADLFGSLAIGKKPGIVCIQGLSTNFKINTTTQIQRIL